MAAGRQVIERNRVQTEEEYLTLPSGDRVFLATKGPLQDSDGRVIGIFGISATDAKRAEADLREREGLFRALVEQSLAGIYIIQQGRLCYRLRIKRRCTAGRVCAVSSPIRGWWPALLKAGRISSGWSARAVTVCRPARHGPGQRRLAERPRQPWPQALQAHGLRAAQLAPGRLRA